MHWATWSPRLAPQHGAGRGARSDRLRPRRRYREPVSDRAARAGTGNAQDNLLQGNEELNTLTGGPGVDLLRGGAGDDVYIYNLGDGSDRIEELLGEGVDTLRLGAGITTSAVSLVRESGRILLRVAGQEIDLTIPAGVVASGVEFIEFASGERWDVLAMTAIDNPPEVLLSLLAPMALGGQAFEFVVPEGTFADEDPSQLQLSVPPDSLPSWLTFDVASRTFSGTPPVNTGMDYELELRATDASGQAVSTWFSLELRNPVSGTSADNTMNGTATRDAMFGLAGNDTLNGMAGADHLVGGAGNDTYVVDNEDDRGRVGG
ncbi:MAG: putative Ig domain-containing protein [Xanthomonadales bacterium]|nr:putative Ig domain-containing protein [Xanthomonadales bacterium]